MDSILIRTIISIFVFNFQTVFNKEMDCSGMQLTPEVKELCKYCVAYAEINITTGYGNMARYPDEEGDPPDCDCRYVACTWTVSGEPTPTWGQCTSSDDLEGNTVFWPLPGQYESCQYLSALTREQHPRGTKPSKSSKSSTINTVSTKQAMKHRHTKIRCDEDSDLNKEYSINCPDSATSIQEYIKPEMKLKMDETLEQKTKLEIHVQNKQLLVRLLDFGIYNKIVGAHPPRLGFILLEYSTSIYTQFCPIVPADFVTNIFQLFYDLHRNTAHDRTEIISETEYKWIYKILANCSRNEPLFKPIVEHPCSDKLFAADNCTNFICTEAKYEYNLNRTDPIVDSMWKVYELVHSVCFPSFDNSYRMFHKYSHVIMDLFTKPIRLRWANQLANIDFWKSVLGPNYNVHLINMERCTKATIERSALPYRLPRHTLVERPRLHGDPGQIIKCRGNNKIVHLQLAILTDATGTYMQFFEEWIKIIPDFLKAFSKEFPSIEFALTTFQDYAYFGKTEEAGLVYGNCYKLEQPFTKDHNTIIKKIPEMLKGITGGTGGDGPESSLTGILYTAVDKTMGWTKKKFLNGRKVHKIVAFTTDTTWKSKEDLGGAVVPPGKKDAKGDGTDTCDSVPPAAKLVRDVLKTNDVFLLGLLASGAKPTWDNYMDKYEFDADLYKMVPSSTDASKLAKQLIKELSEVIYIDQCMR